MDLLFHNVAPFVREISWALAGVFGVSFAVGWWFARKPNGARGHEDL